MKGTFRKALGIFLILLGFSFISEQLGLFGGVDVGWLLGWFWPFAMILIGYQMQTKGNTKLAVFIYIFGGFAILAKIIGWSLWSVFWPIIIIYIGITMLVDDKKSNVNFSEKTSSAQDELNETVIFWGINKKIKSENFKGGEVTAVFGGGEVDLSDVKLAKGGARLEVSAVFGGLKIVVDSEKYKVNAKGDGIFGGWENKFTSSSKKGSELLEITGSAVFGGVEIVG